MYSPKITIATRESRLALWQAEHIRHRIMELYPDAAVDLLGMTTTGDRILDKSLAAVGGKGLFVKELEVAMQEGRAHLAVHSLKDVPMELPSGFSLFVAGPREDPRDAWVSPHFGRLEELPPDAIVGTSSLRRACQLRARYPHLRIEPLRGNLDTRLRKLDTGEYHGIVLAAAGLRRLGLGERIRALMSVEESLPAGGQGALGLEFPEGHPNMAVWLAPLRDTDAEVCVRAERALSRRLAGSCDVPLGAHAILEGGKLKLRAFVGSPEGDRILKAQGEGSREYPEALGYAVSEQLLAQGAADILDRCRKSRQSEP